ncbi:hypothetical protein SVAN01_00540 [Stagonosporopsis vannaccii]|nr:hypothetical protein SVAN01_00540 [Stagonosporopsis vannaccii]
MVEESDTNTKTISNLDAAQQSSLKLKQSLNSLADMVNKPENSAAVQELRIAMRRWGDDHRHLLAERDSKSQS